MEPLDFPKLRGCFDNLKAAKKYDLSSHTYEELHRNEQINKINLISNEIHPKADDCLLNIGCGPFFSDKIFDCRKYGIDPSHRLLEIARQNNVKAKLTLGLAEKLPYPNKYFDYIISVTAFHHVQDLHQALCEIKRVLKKHPGSIQIALSILNSSLRYSEIEKAISSYFTVKKLICEGRDNIFFI
jgi:ubiquinone/menaquinone biosynthesis C-methylase UbiE